MKYVFVHMSGVSFDGDTLEQAPLGGTETALIGVATALARYPENEVHVFSRVKEDRSCRAVHYHPLEHLGSWSEGHDIDVLLSIRQWIPLVMPIRARWRVYFSPDAFDQPFLHQAFAVGLTLDGSSLQVPILSPRDFLPHLDEIFCVGHWQAQSFVSQLSFPAEKIFVTRNGIFPENFSALPLRERNLSLAYSSTPYRGLTHLISIFPELKRHFPELKLEICSGMGVYGVNERDDQGSYGQIYNELKKLGANLYGSIPQKELARVLCSSRVFAYPNSFAETFCISVLEAQASGLPVVSSRRAALVERVEHGVDGFLIEGEPGTPDYQKNFVEHSRELLGNDLLWQRMSEAALQKAKSYSYADLAREWQEHFIRKGVQGLKMHPGAWDEFWNMTQYLARHPLQPSRQIHFDASSLRHFLTQYAAYFGYREKRKVGS